MPKGFVYILSCSNGSYYTGSTIDLNRRMAEHFSGKGANHTKKYPPIELVYVEPFTRIDNAFYREKQIQNWGHAKKEALIENNIERLHELANCQNISNYKMRNARGE